MAVVDTPSGNLPNPVVVPVTALNGVGEILAEKLKKLGITTVQDVLFHLPIRYENRTRLTAINELLPGQHVLVAGEVLSSQILGGGRRSLIVTLRDATGVLVLRFFNFYASQIKQLSEGNTIQCFGEIRSGYTSLEMIHPEYRIIPNGQMPQLEKNLSPVYPATAGVQQKRLRSLTDQVLDTYLSRVTEVLPQGIREQFQLSDLRSALLQIHRPGDSGQGSVTDGPNKSAIQRLAFEELLAQHISLVNLREQRKQLAAIPIPSAWPRVGEFLSSLPFQLTVAQQKVIAEISGDLSKPFPMMRLLQGDVGSGKTVVAAVAAVQAVDHGYQVALMAPTELLAEQHFENFKRWLSPLGIVIELLTGKLTAAQRRDAQSCITDGEAQITIGTHALIQESTQFQRLGLIIIDEQHRFGVEQRLALSRKATHSDAHTHQLVMTATPIPRSLAMTFYADLELSVIDELPPGRQAIKTVVIPENRRAEIVERILSLCQSGRQAYWVCGLIDESEVLEAQAASDMFESLSAALPTLKVGLIHGRMKSAEKEATMRDFKIGTIDLLVATTVIEVGVDVPNASLMIIENSERLGLAQLHQLRGRVGRGTQESSCLLMYKGKLSHIAQARLSTMRETNDGFEIARRDLELRGPGELLGTRQTGIQQLKVADLADDEALLPQIVEVAQMLREAYPETIPELLNRWMGNSQDYTLS